MSWASHNPELYDEITRKGIVKYLDGLLQSNGFDPPGEWLDGYTALVEVLQAENSSAYTILLNLASKQIIDAETDHFSRLADQARERYKDAH